ncbi:hypothetical protein CCACVL1_08370 [Corchorus capsularis]|uniref:Uncharacterized protein n=1 Tax=Corchorus capsularis TaxID=210143 RepID=A0A1R3J103_COCAP|nr:hypothetical protein CCACVL1_08370 [Corchorus capsularis]
MNRTRILALKKKPPKAVDFYPSEDSSIPFHPSPSKPPRRIPQELWDFVSHQKLRTLRGCHSGRVGSLGWNNNDILTTGGMDGQIVNNDVRIVSHVVGAYRGHRSELCGLKWSTFRQQLASGSNDNLVHIWDRSMASSNSPRQWLHKLEDHTAVVKAIS